MTDARRRSPGVVVTTLALCGTVVSLQQTLVLPLLPELPRLLDTTADNASWLVTATLLSGAVSTPIISRLADMYGKRRMIMVSLLIMAVGSVIGVLSRDLVTIIVARALQGVGLALVPVGIAAMRDELPRERVPLGVALMSATLAIGAGAGLPLSGLISEHWDWHAIFWVTGVAGIALLAAVTVVLSESPVRTGGSFDYRGALLLSVALTAILLALSKGGEWGWASGRTVAVGLGGLALLAVWVPVELRVPNPLVDVRVAARRSVLLVNVAALLLGFAFFANVLVTTVRLQAPAGTGYGVGLDVFHTGLWMAPAALVFGAIAPASAWLIRRFGPAATLLGGALIMVLAYVFVTFSGAVLWRIVAGSMLVNAGGALTYAAMPTLIMRSVPLTETASANGLNTLLRALGTSTSSAVMAALASIGFVVVGGTAYPSHASLQTGLWLAAAAAAGPALLAVPMLRVPEFGSELVREPEHRLDTLAVGCVVTPSAAPIRNAVVTVLTLEGDPVDWAQVDPAGRFSIAVPGPGTYLFVAAAEGWVPRSHLVEIASTPSDQTIELSERLTLDGSVRELGRPAAGALVTVTSLSGELVARTRTDGRGRYEIPLPHNGRYVVTAVGTRSWASTSAPVLVGGTGRTADLELVPDEGPGQTSAF